MRITACEQVQQRGDGAGAMMYVAVVSALAVAALAVAVFTPIRKRPAPGVTEEQARAYCTYMCLDPTPETIRQIRKKTPLDLHARAARNFPPGSVSLPHAVYEMGRYDRFLREFGCESRQNDYAHQSVR